MTLSTFDKAMNLSELAEITGNPTTTLIHHIPGLLDKNFIEIIIIKGKRGKFYSVTEKYHELIKKYGSQPNTPNEDVTTVDISSFTNEEYKDHVLKELSGLIKEKKLTSEMLDSMISLATFNKSMVLLITNYMKNMISKINNGKENEVKMALGDLNSTQMSITISNTIQLKKLVELNADYVKNLILIKKEFHDEIKSNNLDFKILDKVFINLFIGPVPGSLNESKNK